MTEKMRDPLAPALRALLQSSRKVKVKRIRWYLIDRKSEKERKNRKRKTDGTFNKDSGKVTGQVGGFVSVQKMEKKKLANEGPVIRHKGGRPIKNQEGNLMINEEHHRSKRDQQTFRL